MHKPNVKNTIYALAALACVCAFVGVLAVAPDAGQVSGHGAVTQGVVATDEVPGAHGGARDARGVLRELLEHESGNYDPGSVVLQHTDAARAEEIAAACGATLRITGDGSYAQLSLPDGLQIADLCESEAFAPYLTDIEPDWHAQLAADTSFNDPGYADQGYLDYINPGDGGSLLAQPTATDAMLAPLVAIVDSGIDTANAEFAGRISELSYNASTDKVAASSSEGLGVVEDEYGHGTQVAGVLAAAANNGTGVVGMAGDARILMVKCAVYTSGGGLKDASDISFGIYYAAENGADVINLSLTATTERGNDPFSSAVEFAKNRGVICVSAAGNDGRRGEEVATTKNWPAANDDVIGVGALASGSQTQRADYSNYGPNTNVMAPGTIKTITTTTAAARRIGADETISGTSFACPIVAGAVLRYVVAQPGDKFATIDEAHQDVIDAIESSATDLGDAGRDEIFGFGRLDMAAFIEGEQGRASFDMNTANAANAQVLKAAGVDAATLENETHTFVKGHALQALPDPEHDGIKLAGWYTDAGCTALFDYLNTPLNTDSIVLYAKWEQDSDDGSGDDDDELDTAGIFTYKAADDADKAKGVAIAGFAKGDAGKHDAVVDIPASIEDDGERYTVTAIAYGAFNGVKDVAEFKLPGTLVKIEALAFANNSALETFTMPKNVGSVGGSILANCASLSAVKVEAGGNCACVAVDNVLFNWSMSTLMCYPGGLENEHYTVPASVTSVAYNAFYNAWKLKGLSFAAGSGVTELPGYAFAYCSSLESAEIPDTVTSIGDCAFYGAVSLASVELPAGLTSVGEETFGSCAALASIEVPASVTSIGRWAFENCSALEQVEFADGCAVQRIGFAAFLNTGLESFTLPASVGSLGSHAFHGCKRLARLRVEDGSKLTSWPKYALWGCSSLAEFSFGTGSALKTLEYASVAKVDALETADLSACAALSEVDGYAFANNVKLQVVKVPCGVSASARERMLYAAPDDCVVDRVHYGETYDSVENVVESTCTEHGSHDLVPRCSVCGEQVGSATHVVDPLIEHSWDEGVSTATCEQKGTMLYTCTRCGATKEEGEVAALGHDWDEGVVGAEPTCTEDGVLLKTCKRDPSHTMTEPIPALGHDWVASETVTEPTCTEDGVRQLVCSRCSELGGTEPIPALGHDWKWVMLREAAPSEDGLEQQVCSRCGESGEERAVAYVPLPVSGGVFTCSRSVSAYTGTPVPATAFRLVVGGATLRRGIDYEVEQSTLASGRVTFTARGGGVYGGSVSTNGLIVPAKVTGVSVKAKKGRVVKVRWSTAKARAAAASGYEVVVKRGARTLKTLRVSKVKTGSATVKLAKKWRGAKVKVTVRAYKTLDGVRRYGAASATKTANVKR